jgi:hypothetical protein
MARLKLRMSKKRLQVIQQTLLRVLSSGIVVGADEVMVAARRLKGVVLKKS